MCVSARLSPIIDADLQPMRGISRLWTSELRARPVARRESDLLWEPGGARFDAAICWIPVARPRYAAAQPSWHAERVGWVSLDDNYAAGRERRALTGPNWPRHDFRAATARSVIMTRPRLRLRRWRFDDPLPPASPTAVSPPCTAHYVDPTTNLLRTWYRILRITRYAAVQIASTALKLVFSFYLFFPCFFCSLSSFTTFGAGSVGGRLLHHHHEHTGNITATTRKSINHGSNGRQEPDHNNRNMGHSGILGSLFSCSAVHQVCKRQEDGHR